jgi:hypothetical protein
VQLTGTALRHALRDVLDPQPPLVAADLHRLEDAELRVVAKTVAELNAVLRKA